MTLDYFYGAQADQFAFYRIPKALFTDERFKSISAEAKILYGILLDRMSLSRKNGWLDEPGARVYHLHAGGGHGGYRLRRSEGYQAAERSWTAKPVS